MRPVHLAGTGAVTGFGEGRATLMAGLRSGERAIRPRDRTAGGPIPSDVAAEVPGLGHVAVGDRALSIALVAAREALDASGVRAAGVPLVLASTKGELTGAGFGPTAETGTGLGSPARLAARLSAELGTDGVLAAVSCACASGLVALSLAARRVAHGAADRVLVVGVDVLDAFILAGFGGLHALDPSYCRPFDRARRGVNPGDGAAAILLTCRGSESSGARLVGWGGANDACHVTGPDREGLGVATAGERALRQAQVAPDDVDLLHLHGTGTEANDGFEASGVVKLFGGATPPAFGTKAQTGHTLGAAGVVETVVLTESLLAGEALPNVGLEQPGVDGRLDLVRERRAIACASGQGRVGLKVAAGFGGIIASVVVAT